MAEEVRFKQITGVGQLVYGLTEDGRVYQFRLGLMAWVPIAMGVKQEAPAAS